METTLRVIDIVEGTSVDGPACGHQSILQVANIVAPVPQPAYLAA